jgi:hypothetical protein
MTLEITDLQIRDVPSIVALEKACWPADLQASSETILQRLQYGHVMMGGLAEGELVAMMSWRYANFSPDDFASFPKTFDQFSTKPSVEPHNAAFVYNLCVHPKFRGSSVVKELFVAGLARRHAAKCRYLVADGRCPSYNGIECETESIKQSSIFRAAIDRHISGGCIPSLEEFTADPTLRFYRRTLQCEFLWVIPEFMPADTASGGFRVIYYKELF